MFQQILIALVAAVGLFIGYLLVRAYYPSLFSSATARPVAPPPPPTVEPFAGGKPQGPPIASKTNTAMPPVPAPAPPIKQDPPQEERTVSPGGPGAPNAAAPEDTPATISPEAKPIDPYADNNMEAPIQDSMRHPELSFGPGVDNTGMNKLATSGVASARVTASESPFSPDFAQNGANFMGTVYANDLSKDDRFASA